MIESHSQLEKQSDTWSIGHSYNKITKLTYGRNGLLTFLSDLFMVLDEKDK